MGGQDKGWVEIAGKSMVNHVLEALAPQVSRVLINANRNLERYRSLGVTVIEDRLGGYQGPLAGVASALEATTTPLLLTVPCDAPLLPHDLAWRLYQSLEEQDAEIAVASSAGRLQTVFLLLRREVLEGLRAFLAEDDRKIDRWIPRHRWTAVDLSDCPQCFVNVNSPEDLTVLELRLNGSAGAVGG
jgi:molybdopterin-guanine dinucleotide biosynthesis protein A